MPVKPKVAIKEPIEEICTCLSCGSAYKKQEGNFLKSTFSQLWNYNNKYFPVCKSCLEKLFKEYIDRYQSEETALKIICHYMDIPFYSSLYQSIIEKNTTFAIGLYCRNLNQRQFQYKTFLNSIIDGELLRTQDEVKEEKESKWSKKDKQNMNYSISTIGYDPFDDLGMTDMDRKYCFNILAVYCDVEGVKDDGHKLQSVIQLTNLHLQCKKLDESMNYELLQAHPDENRIKVLTSSKKQLLDSISKIAQDNNIASNYNKNSKQGQNTLTKKMKQIDSDGFENIKVNLFDIRTSSAMKQIADLSNQSILEQLTLDSNEYSEMIKEQRESLLKIQDDYAELQEENRILKNTISDLKSNVKKGGR